MIGEPQGPNQSATPASISDVESAENIAVERKISIGDRLKSPQTIISFIIAFVIIIFIFRNLNLDVRSIWQNIKSANPVPLVFAFAIYYTTFPLRALRWRVFLRNAGISRSYGYEVPGVRGLSEIYILSWFANCLVPAKLGDAYRGYLLKKNAQPSFSRTIGTIFAERVIDVFALVIFIAAAVFVVFGQSVPSSVRFPLIVASILVATVILGLFAVTKYSHQVRGIVPERFRPYYIRVEGGLRNSFSRSGAGTVLLLTIGIWALEGVRIFLVAAAFSVFLDPAEAVFVALLASLLTVIPITPSGLGFVEGGVIVALKLLGVDDADAGTIAIVDRVIAYWSVIIIGAIVYIFSKHK